MKKCPQCGQIYTEDNSFCLMDGTALTIASYGNEEIEGGTDAPTVFISKFPSAVSSTAPPSFPKWIFPLIAVLVGLVLVLGFLVFYNFKETDTDKFAIKTESKKQDQLKTITKVTSPSELTDSSVLNLLDTWESAQDKRNFRIYQTCYAADFQGIKRTKSGSIQRMNLTNWLNDRSRMIAKAKGLNIELKNLKIKIKDDVAVAEFDQFYYSQNYSDWGPKVLRIKLSPDKEPKIFYEELKASYPLK